MLSKYFYMVHGLYFNFWLLPTQLIMAEGLLSISFLLICKLTQIP